MGVTLNLHQLTNGDRARLAHPPDVVASQVNQHNVFGTLLLVTAQFPLQSDILGRGLAPGPGSGQGAGHYPIFLHPDQNLG